MTRPCSSISPRQNPRRGDPAAVLGEDATDLVDVDLPPSALAPEPVDLNRDRQGLLRDHERVEVEVQGRAVPVRERLDLVPDAPVELRREPLDRFPPHCVRPDRMALRAGERVRGQADHDRSARACELERSGQERTVPVVEGVERTPYHNLHPLSVATSPVIWILVQLGADVFLAPNATVLGEVTLGDRVGIWFGAVVRADRDRIAIGADSNVQDDCVVHTTPGRPGQHRPRGLGRPRRGPARLHHRRPGPRRDGRGRAERCR